MCIVILIEIHAHLKIQLTDIGLGEVLRFAQRAPLSLLFRVDLGTFARSSAIQDSSCLLTQCRATAHALWICLYHPLATTRRAFKAHICNSLAPPCITLCYNFSLFYVTFSPLYYFFRPILRQTELIVQLNIPLRPSFARTPPDKPVRLPSSHTSSLRYATTSRLRALYASCSRTFRQVRGSFCYGYRRSTPCFASFDSLYSRKRCRGAHFIMFSFHVEHTSCHSSKPQRLSRFLLVYAYLYIASLRVFHLCVCFFRPCDPFPLSLRG